MADKKIIAVAGATGAQGGGLVRAILADSQGEYTVRAITRNTESEKAQDLANLGAEVVKADLDDPGSIEDAFNGAYGAFCVTNFWEHFSPEKELIQAGNMALAARKTRVRHVVWSTLEDTRQRVTLGDQRMPTLMERYKVPHFDGKGEANGLFRKYDVPTTFLYTSFYWDNFIHFGMGPKPGPDGTLLLTLPMGNRKLPGIAAEDIGRCAYGVFRKGSDVLGKNVGIAGEHLTGTEMANRLSDALGRTVKYNPVSFNTYRGFGFPGSEDLGNMFQYKHDFEADFCGARSVEESRALNPDLQTFAQWLEANAFRIPTE